MGKDDGGGVVLGIALDPDTDYADLAVIPLCEEVDGGFLAEGEVFLELDGVLDVLLVGLFVGLGPGARAWQGPCGG